MNTLYDRILLKKWIPTLVASAVHRAMGLPSFEDLSDSYSRGRVPTGPTLLFQQ